MTSGIGTFSLLGFRISCFEFIYGGAGRGGRTHTDFTPADFKSAASADSAIPARTLILLGFRLGMQQKTETRNPNVEIRNKS